MKKILLNLLASVQFCVAVGGTIKMPNKDVLQKKFNSVGMEPLTKATNVIEQLADQNKVSFGIATIIDSSLHRYFENLKQGTSDSDSEPIEMINSQMIISRSLILKALLEDEPAALEELKACGLYNPIKES